MTITRLTGGLTPGDGGDPRTFPAIFNDAADLIEAQGTAIGDLEDLNPVQFGTAVGSAVANELLQYDGSDWVNVGQAEAGAIPVFAGTAARGSAIPSPTEGMVTYRSDDDVVEVYDGSSFNVLGGGLVAVKSAINTDAEAYSSIAAGANVAVDDLSITHEVANASNRLIISAFFGAAGNSFGLGNVGIAVHDGSGLIAVGASPGDRVAVTAGGNVVGTTSNVVVTMPSVTFVHTPGAGSKTYTVRAINIRATEQTLFINRSESDADSGNNQRSVSSLVIQEVAV